MRTTLALVITIVFGIVPTALILVRDVVKESSLPTFSLGTAYLYADRAIWLVVGAAGFVLYDFIRKASDIGNRDHVSGGMIAWIVSICGVLLPFNAALFGIV